MGVHGIEDTRGGKQDDKPSFQHSPPFKIHSMSDGPELLKMHFRFARNCFFTTDLELEDWFSALNVAKEKLGNGDRPAT